MILSTKPGATIGGNLLPVSYSKFTSMIKQGDTIFLGRYLVTGSEESSCYLTVRTHFSGGSKDLCTCVQMIYMCP